MATTGAAAEYSGPIQTPRIRSASVAIAKPSGATSARATRDPDTNARFTSASSRPAASSAEIGRSDLSAWSPTIDGISLDRRPRAYGVTEPTDSSAAMMNSSERV